MTSSVDLFDDLKESNFVIELEKEGDEMDTENVDYRSSMEIELAKIIEQTEYDIKFKEVHNQQVNDPIQYYIDVWEQKF